MVYAVIAVAALGVISGFLFKLRSFLVVVGIFFVALVAFSAVSGMSFVQAVGHIVGGQFVLQFCYFVGAAISVMSGKSGRRPYVL